MLTGKLHRRLFLDRWDSSCARTTFSRILERNGRLETGLKFFRSFTSSPDFFSRGLTMADFETVRNLCQL